MNERKNKNECWQTVSSLFLTLSLIFLFSLTPSFSLSFHPVHPGKHSGSEGWINKGGKVEHNSLRSAFSGTLTQRNTQYPERPWHTLANVRQRATCFPLTHYWGDETGWGEKAINPYIPSSTCPCLWEGLKRGRGDWEKEEEVGGQEPREEGCLRV